MGHTMLSIALENTCDLGLFTIVILPDFKTYFHSISQNLERKIQGKINRMYKKKGDDTVKGKIIKIIRRFLLNRYPSEIGRAI